MEGLIPEKPILIILTYIYIYISLSLSLLLLCYTATLLAEFYYCLLTDYSFLLNNTPLLPTYFPLPLYNPTPH